MDLPKIASRVAILFGGPPSSQQPGTQYEYLTRTDSVELDPNSWYDTPTYIFKGQFTENGQTKDVEIVVVYQRDVPYGVKRVTGIDPGRLALPDSDPNSLGVLHPIWAEFADIVTDSDVYADMDEVYNGPTPAQQQMMDAWEQRVPGQPGVTHPTVDDVLKAGQTP